MPFRSTSPLVRVELDSMSTIDTRNVENLFGLWSVFHKCANTMEDGKRLENLSWRLWNRETFCCASEQSTGWSRRRCASFASRASSEAIPSLSSSMSSDVSSSSSALSVSTRGDEPEQTSHASATSSSLIPARPELRRLTSSHQDSHNKGNEKHITPVDLKQIVVSIRETTGLEKLPPLPASLAVQPHQQPASTEMSSSSSQSFARDTTPRPSSTPQTMAPESSTSTVATASTAYSGEISPPAESNASTSTNMSSHSVVHGFQLGRISSSIRSSSNLANTPTPILKRSLSPSMKTVYAKNGLSKRKQPTFMLGGSSGEEPDSSLETRYAKSSLSESLKRGSGKTASFANKDDIIDARRYDEEVFESDSEDESESAIEDDIEDDWEDEDEHSGPPSISDQDLFKRVDSRPNLTSRRSLLTQAINEPDSAAEFCAKASKSKPIIRRSRTSTPNGPSLACTPKEDSGFETDATGIRPKPIIMTTSNATQPLPAMSPRTTRRHMLSSEMTESLRKNLLWERQQKNNTANAHLKRRHTSNDIKNLTQFPHSTESSKASASHLPTITDHKALNSWSNNHFDSGLLEYHSRGW